MVNYIDIGHGEGEAQVWCMAESHSIKLSDIGPGTLVGHNQLIEWSYNFPCGRVDHSLQVISIIGLDRCKTTRRKYLKKLVVKFFNRLLPEYRMQFLFDD